MKIEAAPADWSKREKLKYLLEQRTMIFDPDACSPFGAPGDGSGVALLPLMARHPSVVELERTLKILLNVQPGDYRHLAAFYWGCEYRIVWLPTRIRGPRGKIIQGDPKPERRRVLHSWVKMARVTNAECFLEDRFRGEVFIPDELWDALNTPAVAA